MHKMILKRGTREGQRHIVQFGSRGPACPVHTVHFRIKRPCISIALRLRRPCMSTAHHDDTSAAQDTHVWSIMTLRLKMHTMFAMTMKTTSAQDPFFYRSYT